jgi:hypothetical protein
MTSDIQEVVTRKSDAKAEKRESVIVKKCAYENAKAFTLGSVTWFPMPNTLTVTFTGACKGVQRTIRTVRIPTVSGWHAFTYKWGGYADSVADPMWKSGPRKGHKKTSKDAEKLQDARIKKIMDGTYRHGTGRGPAQISVTDYCRECVYVTREAAKETAKWADGLIARVQKGSDTEKGIIRECAVKVAVYYTEKAKPSTAQIKRFQEYVETNAKERLAKRDSSEIDPALKSIIDEIV